MAPPVKKDMKRARRGLFFVAWSPYNYFPDSYYLSIVSCLNFLLSFPVKSLIRSRSVMKQCPTLFHWPDSHRFVIRDRQSIVPSSKSLEKAPQWGFFIIVWSQVAKYILSFALNLLSTFRPRLAGSSLRIDEPSLRLRSVKKGSVVEPPLYLFGPSC